MAWTTADLTALEEAILSGVKEVQYTDKKVVYQDLDDMIKAYDFIKGAVASSGAGASGGSKSGIRVTSLSYSSGLKKGNGCGC